MINLLILKVLEETFLSKMRVAVVFIKNKINAQFTIRDQKSVEIFSVLLKIKNFKS